MTKEVTLKPYDDEIAQDVFDCLFHTNNETEDGYFEIPADSYQLVKSALELIKWEVRSAEGRDAISKTINLVAFLRDKQKAREWSREKEGK